MTKGLTSLNYEKIKVFQSTKCFAREAMSSSFELVVFPH